MTYDQRTRTLLRDSSYAFIRGNNIVMCIIKSLHFFSRHTYLRNKSNVKTESILIFSSLSILIQHMFAMLAKDFNLILLMNIHMHAKKHWTASYFFFFFFSVINWSNGRKTFVLQSVKSNQDLTRKRTT